MSKDDNTWLWIALGAAAVFFLMRKSQSAAPPPALPAPPTLLPPPTVTPPPTPDLTAAATNATAPPFSSETDFGISADEAW
jgi:hypothetical protein